jgi:hypothetical protein
MKLTSYGVAWIFLGALTLGGVLISLGKRETATNPSLNSYGPSGLAAFGRLLSENGYRVDSTLTSMPSYESKDDVLIVPMNSDAGFYIDKDSEGLGLQLSHFLEKGGRVLLLRMPMDFSGGRSSMRDSTVVQRLSGKKLKIRSRPGTWSELAPPDLPPTDVSVTIWKMENSPEEFGGLTRYGSGLAFTIGDGFIATNRYIDDAQNADVLIRSLNMIAPPRSRLVFLESAFRENQPSVIEILGPGAVAAWLQVLFLFLVVVFTLGKRFGLAEEPPPVQAGQRELVDAIADTYRRAKATRIACRAAYDRADQEVRRKLKLGPEAPASERDRHIPEALSLEFRRVFEATIDALPAKDAFDRCQALQRQVRRFLARDEVAARE